MSFHHRQRTLLQASRVPVVRGRDEQALPATIRDVAVLAGMPHRPHAVEDVLAHAVLALTLQISVHCSLHPPPAVQVMVVYARNRDMPEPVTVLLT